MCSPAIFETSLSYNRDILIAGTYCYMYFYINVLFSLTSYFPINKFDSFIIFSFLFNAVILLLNCLVLILSRFLSYLAGGFVC